jgi:phage-related protein (TIGR01555 family)
MADKMTAQERKDNEAHIAQLQENIQKLRKTGLNVDGWLNVFAGLGGRSDKTEQTCFGEMNTLSDEELTRLWLGEGLGKKIVSSVADDMTRNWFTVEGDSDNEIQKELMRLNAETKINTALKWARLYRGAIVIVGARDGRGLEKPLNIGRVEGIDWLQVYSAPKVEVQEKDIVKDPASKYFGEVEIFTVRKRNGTEFKVHRSRCLIFKGDPLPDNYENFDVDREYWGVSILQSVYRNLKDFGAIYQSVANLMLELIIGKYKLNNLAQLLSENNTQAIYTRMEIINASKSLINGVMLGEGEEYTRDSANITGVPEIMDRFMMLMSAVVEIPVTRLFGRSPAGENATGDADLRGYYDMAESKQGTWLMPPMMDLVSLVNSYKKAVETDPMIKFNPVWVPSLKELIEMRKQQAETDRTYIETGVLGSEEVRKNRFVGGYSFETSVEGELTPKEVDNNKKKKEEEEE